MLQQAPSRTQEVVLEQAAQMTLEPTLAKSLDQFRAFTVGVLRACHQVFAEPALTREIRGCLEGYIDGRELIQQRQEALK